MFEAQFMDPGVGIVVITLIICWSLHLVGLLHSY